MNPNEAMGYCPLIGESENLARGSPDQLFKVTEICALPTRYAAVAIHVRTSKTHSLYHSNLAIAVPAVSSYALRFASAMYLANGLRCTRLAVDSVNGAATITINLMRGINERMPKNRSDCNLSVAHTIVMVTCHGCLFASLGAFASPV